MKLFRRGSKPKGPSHATSQSVMINDLNGFDDSVLVDGDLSN